MKKQILEVQDYFTNKITACDFTIEKISTKYTGWTEFEILVDGEFPFNFSVFPNPRMFCFHGGFVKAIVPDDRLENLINLIDKRSEEIKREKINALKEELSKLEA